MAVIFDPGVIGVAAVQVRGWKAMVKRITALGLATVTLDSLFLFVAGGAYLHGLMFSTLARKSGSSAVFAAGRGGNTVIVSDPWKRIGPGLPAGPPRPGGAGVPRNHPGAT